MSHALVNKVRYVTGLTFGEKSILYRLADAARGDEAFLRMDRLALYAGCNERTARRILRRLENLGVIIPRGGQGGRGYVHVYRFNLDPKPPPDPEASTPPPPPEGAEPSTNGASPPTRPNLSVYDDPRMRRDNESATEWAARIDKLNKNR